jgi:cyclase
VYQFTGDSEKTIATKWRSIEWVKHVQELGAGEIVLNCMNQDGVRQGYDIRQLQQVREYCTVPLIASGGAGVREHFLHVFRDAGVDGALAASVFHSGEMAINDLKHYLNTSGIHVRT